MKNFLKISLPLVLLVSLFSCSDDLTIEPWEEVVDSEFKAYIYTEGSTMPDSITVVPDAYTTQIEYDYNNDDNEVTESGSFEAVRILATDGMNDMALIFPASTVEGTYHFSDTQGMFLANVMTAGAEGGTQTNRAKSGTLTITLHNTTAHYVEGLFGFDTADESVVDGEFRAYYTVE